MRRLLLVALLLAAGCASIVPFVTLVGLGAHRHGAPWAVSASAVLLVYAPTGLVALAWARERALGAASTLLAWSLALFLVFPVYFPGERRQALSTGIALLGLDTGWLGLPERLASTLPEEPAVARPEVAEAAVVEVAGPPPARAMTEDQIALPYEGEGRRLSLPVTFAHGAAGGGPGGPRELELEMMLDTGATYTTLGREDLRRLGVTIAPDAPTIELHTANGVRTSEVVLLDGVWLGDLEVGGVAIAVCDECVGEGTAGLLGLNVTGGFNLQIDADHREVVFSRREAFDRKLDVRPFTDLDATFTRFPGGRVEVEVTLANRSPRQVERLTASVRCVDPGGAAGAEPGGHWSARLEDVEPGDTVSERRKLPRHDACEQYEIGVLDARW